MRRRRCDRSYGLGPLPFYPEGDGGGDGAGGGAGAGTGTPPAGDGAPAPGTPPPAGGSGGGEPDRSGWIPRDRFDTVNAELQKLRSAEEERQRQDLEAKGEHEKLAAAEKAKREQAEQRALAIARRAAFIAAAAGKVSDPEAAYKLANADGLLNDLEVDDDGNAKDAKKPGAIVDDLVKAYEFLKPTTKTRDFGGPNGGQGGQPAGDPSKMSADELLRGAYAASPVTGRGSRG